MHWCDELGMFSVAKKLWLNHQCHRWCIFQIYWYLQREVQTFLLHGKPSICTCICAICYFSSILMFAITFAAASGLIYCKAYFKTVQEVTRLKCKRIGQGHCLTRGCTTGEVRTAWSHINQICNNLLLHWFLRSNCVMLLFYLLKARRSSA